MSSYNTFKRTLLGMCAVTTPHGCESYVWAWIPKPKEATVWIQDGNYITVIPGRGDNIIWACHCDTADDTPTVVNKVVDGHRLSTDGSSILGADDKVGCAIMAMMIKAKVPGTYIFFSGEERGCIGSTRLAKLLSPGEYDAILSLDRRGTSSIITHQIGGRCCSDSWATKVAATLHHNSGGYIDLKIDPSGVVTDSAQFTDVIGECTNISVGYYSQHTTEEWCDMHYAWRLCCALIKTAVDGLPTPERNPGDKDEEDDLWYRFGSYHRKDYTDFPRKDYTDFLLDKEDDYG